MWRKVQWTEAELKKLTYIIYKENVHCAVGLKDPDTFDTLFYINWQARLKK